jgi:Yip1 domain
VALFSSLLINSLGAVKEQRLEIQDRVLQKMVEKGRMTKEQAERASRDAQAGASGKTLVWQSLWPFVASFVAPFWSALFIWLGGSVIMRGRFSYMRALEVAGLASMIGMLGSIVRALMVVVMGNMFAGPSPAVFIKNFDSFNTWHVALISINLFGLWELGVQASGMAKLSGASYGKSAAWIYGVWIAFATLLIGVSFAFRKLMGF